MCFLHTASLQGPVYAFPTGEREGHRTPVRPGMGGGHGRVLPGALGSPGGQPLLPARPRLLGRPRPLRGARSLRGPVGFVTVSFRCAALKERLRHLRPVKRAPARHRPPCSTVAAFPSGVPVPRAGQGSPGGSRRARPPRSHLSSSRRKRRAQPRTLEPGHLR